MSDAPRIDPATHMGAVHLTVADLDRSLGYYERTFGLVPADGANGSATLRAGENDLLVLVEEPGARPVSGHAGLFHFALLVPERADLARWLLHVAEARIPLTGLSEHLVSEAIYLRDPDGHGIEIYRDRPREEWQREGDRIVLATLPLDVDDLLTSVAGEDPREHFTTLPAGTVMGHVHLHVGDIPATEEFYDGVLGFDVTEHLGTEATFLSAGGYHHHLGANVWAGRGVTQPPPGSAALRRATVLLPSAEARDAAAARAADAGQGPEPVDDGVLVRDPAGNLIVLAVA